MDSTYHLKTGEVTDLSQIVHIGNLRKIGKNKPHEFEIILKTASCKIVINAYPVGNKIREAYYSEIGSKPSYDFHIQEHAVDAATEVYMSFCKEVRNGLISAWEKYKEEYGS